VDDDWNAPRAARRTTRAVVREELEILSWIRYIHSLNTKKKELVISRCAMCLVRGGDSHFPIRMSHALLKEPSAMT